MAVTHWKKLEANRNETRVLTLVKEKPRNWTELIELTNFSPNTLLNHLKKLQDKKMIRKAVNTEGKDCYETISESIKAVNAQIGKYEATQFIEALQNPIFGSEKYDNLTVSAFAQVADLKDRAKTEKQFKKTVLPALNIAFSSFSESPLAKGDKIALVVTISGGGPKNEK